MMPYRKSIAECKAGLVTTLKRIKFLHGYETELPDANIRSDYSTDFVDNDDDASYPKCCVVIDSGSIQSFPNEGAQSTIRFLLFLTVKQLQEQDTATTLIEKLLDAVEYAIAEDRGLSDTVESAYMREFITDGGVTSPKGHAIVVIEALRSNK